jgi:6,7-dimethyl-8-ribityllumazine synthase
MLSASRKTKDIPDFSGSNPKIAVISARYNPSIADRLTKGASALLDAGDIPFEIFDVSGVLDLATALKLIINSGRFDGYVLLGSVVNDGDDRAATAMYAETLRGIHSIGASGYPLGSAILCASNKKQLAKMASPRKDNCGRAAALAALELIALSRNLSNVSKNIGFKPASEFIHMAGDPRKTT